jgi:hypothetical protein
MRRPQTPTTTPKYSMRYLDLFEAGWKQGLNGRWTGNKPRVFWRGTTSGSTLRIRTGNHTWDQYLFVASDPELARSYGRQLERIDAKPDAKILYAGTRDFRALAKGLKGSLLDVSSALVERAKEQGYDAVWFAMQGNIGTVIINPHAFERNVRPEAATS